jgi:RNA polymerase primary sigma factor
MEALMLDRPNPITTTSRNAPGVDDLVLRWQRDRDERARDRLLQRYLGLIRTLSWRWARKWSLDFDDAEQEGRIGFLRALETYEPATASLGTYAGQWIWSRVGRMRANAQTVALSPNAFNDVGRVSRASKVLRQELGRRPSIEELAAKVGFGTYRLEAVLAALNSDTVMMSMSTPMGEDGDTEFGDFLPAAHDSRPDVLALNRRAHGQARAAILQAAELLPPKWRKVLALRLVEGRSLKEAGAAIGVTRERARQIEDKVIPTLREALKYDARALNLIGREVQAPEEVTRADADGLGVSDVMAMTGLRGKALDNAIRAGTFPAPTRRSHHRGARVWEPAEVNEWTAKKRSVDEDGK